MILLKLISYGINFVIGSGFGTIDRTAFPYLNYHTVWQTGNGQQGSGDITLMNAELVRAICFGYGNRAVVNGNHIVAIVVSGNRKLCRDI